MAIIDKFEKHKIAKVIRAYLVDGKSHRRIQREILNLPAPARGGGFVVMELLHHFDIRGDKKGILKKNSMSQIKKNSTIEFKNAIDIYEELSLLEEEAEEYFVENQVINKNKNPTESISEIKVRVYQNKLREIILSNYNETCAICDISKKDLLICSHIKPWAVDKEERLNPKNVICFCVLHDKMFDIGYFSLNSEYQVIFGQKADNQIMELLKGNSFKAPKVNCPDINFLKFHFDEICQ